MILEFYLLVNNAMAQKEYPSTAQLEELIELQILEIFAVDSKETCASMLPSPTKTVPQITTQFSNKHLTSREMIK